MLERHYPHTMRRRRLKPTHIIQGVDYYDFGRSENQTNNALRKLQEAVHPTVRNHNYANRCLTEDFSFELGFTTPEDSEINGHRG